MPIDPRIALMGAPIEYDTFGAMRQGQEIRQNQMTMQRRADAQAALNAMRQPMSPAVQPAPAMQPGSSGPPIMGAPLPSVNAMGAGAPMPAAAPAAPVNAARDMSTLYQFMDIPEVKNYVDEINRQETARVTAAGRATDDTRLQSAADIQRGNYTNGLLQQGALNLIDDQSDEAIISNAARLAELPGVDVPMINASRDALLAMPPSQRATTVRRTAAIDTGASRAAGLTEPNLVARTDGASSWFEDMNRNSETFGQRFSVTAMQETPGLRRSGENREEDRQRRLDDAQVGLDADAEAAQAEADALAANPRADRDAVAAAQAQAAAAAAAAAANRRLRSGPPPRPAPTAPPRAAAPDRGSPPPAPPAGTPRGATRSNARGTWTWDGSRWQ
jgi:hypothetical protein